MTKFTRNAVVITGLAIVTIATTLVSGQQPNDNKKIDRVEIVNPLPLPVDARITNTAPLGVNASIVSSVPLPLIPAAPAEPFQQTVFVEIAPGTTGNLNSLDVPAGKRLIIESVAGTIFLPTGQFVRVSNIRTDFSGAAFALVGNPVAGQSDSVTVLNHAMKLYASQNVEFSVSRAPASTGSGFCAFAVSGYLVNE